MKTINTYGLYFVSHKNIYLNIPLRRLKILFTVFDIVILIVNKFQILGVVQYLLSGNYSYFVNTSWLHPKFLLNKYCVSVKVLLHWRVLSLVY